MELVTYARKSFTESGEFRDIAIVNAEDVLPRKTFEKLRGDGIGLRIVSDYIRALRIRQRGGGILADGDQLALRPIPRATVTAPRFGHWCATMDRPRSGYRCTKTEAAKKQEMEFLAAPQDWAYAATPAAFSRGSPILDHWIAAMEDQMARRGLKEKTVGGAFTLGGDEERLADASKCAPRGGRPRR